jgi:hypothetical protein
MAPPGHGNDPRAGITLPNPPYDFQTVEARHDKVGDDQVERARLVDEAARLRAILRLRHVVASPFEHALDQRSQQRFVIDHEHPFHGTAPPVPEASIGPADV